jgi:hypothetical protein
VNATSTASGSNFMAKELMPSFLEQQLIILNDLEDIRQLAASKPFGPSDGYRFQPQLRIPFTLLYMDMWRLFPFEAEKEKPIPLYAKHSRHLSPTAGV